MDKYETHLVEITCWGDTHRRYLYRGDDGEQIECRGLRLVSDSDDAKITRRQRRERCADRMMIRFKKIVDSKWWIRGKARKRLRDECEGRCNRFVRRLDLDQWWWSNFHTYTNPMMSLPCVEEVIKN
jgi:hypothetical protein